MTVSCLVHRSDLLIAYLNINSADHSHVYDSRRNDMIVEGMIKANVVAWTAFGDKILFSHSEAHKSAESVSAKL